MPDGLVMWRLAAKGNQLKMTTSWLCLMLMMMIKMMKMMKMMMLLLLMLLPADNDNVDVVAAVDDFE